MRACAAAPSASSRLFSERHSLHYQSKVCVCLPACALIACLPWQGFALGAPREVKKAPFIFPTFFSAFLRLQISTARRCVAHFAHLIGKHSHEQNADSVLVMRQLWSASLSTLPSVNSTTCGCWKVVLCQGLSKLWRGSALGDRSVLQLNSACVSSLPCRYLPSPPSTPTFPHTLAVAGNWRHISMC